MTFSESQKGKKKTVVFADGFRHCDGSISYKIVLYKNGDVRWFE